jgi:DNA repair protein RadA/Sms
MAKAKIVYSCQSCGYQSPKWLGRCPDCNQWNSLVEERQERAAHPRGELSLGSKEDPSPIHAIDTGEEGRVLSGIGEFDRVLGGGLVPGSVILIGGDPGIGKSTLLLQALCLRRGISTPNQDARRTTRHRRAQPARLERNLSRKNY